MDGLDLKVVFFFVVFCFWGLPERSGIFLDGVLSHRIHGTGIFTHMNGCFFGFHVGKYTIHGCCGIKYVGVVGIISHCLTRGVLTVSSDS